VITRQPQSQGPIKYPCRRCGVRWIQTWIGPYARLCRACVKETGAVVPTMREIEAARVQKREQELAAKRVPDRGPRPAIEKVIHGTEYLVVWDGS